jgi:hypothetical protein
LRTRRAPFGTSHSSAMSAKKAALASASASHNQQHPRLRVTVVSPASCRPAGLCRRNRRGEGGGNALEPSKGLIRRLSYLLEGRGGGRFLLRRRRQKVYYPDTLEDTREYSRQVEGPTGRRQLHARHRHAHEGDFTSRSSLEGSDGNDSSSDEFVILVPTRSSDAAAFDSAARAAFPTMRMSVPVVASSMRARPPHYRRFKSKSSPGLSWSGSGSSGSMRRSGTGTFLYTLDEDRQVLPRSQHHLKKMLSSSL